MAYELPSDQSDSNQSISHVLASIFGGTSIGGSATPNGKAIFPAIAASTSTSQTPTVPYRANYGSLANAVDWQKNPLLQLAHAHLEQGTGYGRQELTEFFQKTLGRAINPNNEAWCADFANAVLKTAGLPGTNSALARSFLNYGTEAHTPQVGDLVVFERGHDGVSGHVGFLAGFKDGKMLITGGNQGGKVGVAEFSTNHVLSIRHPPPLPGNEHVPVEQTVAKATTLPKSSSKTLPTAAA